MENKSVPHFSHFSERLARDEYGLTVADVVRLYAADEANQSLLERASQHPTLPAGWREYFWKRLWAPDTG